MIRINLLPGRAARKRWRLIQDMLVWAAIAVGLPFLVLSAYAVLLGRQVGALEVEKSQLEQHAEALKVTVKAVKDLEANNQTYLQKQQVIEDLRGEQDFLVRLLDEVSRSVPQRVWLLGLTQTPQQLEIEGRAASNADLVEFIGNLETISSVEEVELLESRKASAGAVSAYQFKLRCQFKA